MGRMIQPYLNRALPQLPIDDCLPGLVTALAENHAAVLVAAPGAGKTSRVPLVLLDQDWLKGNKIIVLEPRRLAARSAAAHMARLLGEEVGQTVGYRVRLDTRTSTATRIEFVTEGVFSRMILADPELKGIGAVIFDEFHERSLDGDMGLALVLESFEALRPDLRLLVMSATIDGAKVASLLQEASDSMGCRQIKTIESVGRSYPVSIQYQSGKPDERLEEMMARTIRAALQQYEGSLLCFLPGQAEIRRVTGLLQSLPSNVSVFPLYGALDPTDQASAIAPSPANCRKIVLATSIAETSITIDGVTVVIDSGISRVPRYEPDTGLTRLVSVRASKASIDQRAGRAGRTAPGTAIRLWHEGQTGSLPDYERPEILEADLCALALDLVQWGVKDPSQLKWLDLPPRQAWKEAVDLLRQFDAVTDDLSLTEHGQALCALPLPPRLARMVVRAKDHDMAFDAAFLAVLVNERGLGGPSTDIVSRFDNALREKSDRSRKAQNLARQISGKVAALHNAATLSIGAILSFAWPERIAQRMSVQADGSSIFLLANGRRAKVDGLSSLAKEEYLVISDLQGSAGSARILAAAAISLDEISSLHRNTIRSERLVIFDRQSARFRVRKQQRFGAIELSAGYDTPQASDDLAAKVMEQLREDGLDRLTISKEVRAFICRAQFLHLLYPDEVGNFSEPALLADLEEWLLPMAENVRGFSDLTSEKIMQGLQLRLGYENQQRLERLVPRSFQLPSGSIHALHYEGDKVILRARVQEFFGMKIHPAILNGKVPLTLEFLSPAMRPIQKTEDIARFWHGSWGDVRKDLRGRYPKHFWPEDGATAMATSTVKSKMTNSKE